MSRPLVICDADEVLLRFVEGLEVWLPTQGAVLDLQGYALTGNIKDTSTGVPLPGPDVSALIKTFHRTGGLDLQPVAGAAEALAAIAAQADIVVLTNIADDLATARQANLAAHGIPYPVHTNSGLKGPAAARLAAGAGAPVFFIDDIPHNHVSVAEALPHSHRIQFVGDKRLFAATRRTEAAHLLSNSWAEASRWILDRLP